jgi:hypothetical protein
VIGTAASDDAAVVQSAARTPLLRWGAVLWPSFFAAGVAAMVFFALVDPLELAETAWPHLAVSRELGYSLGFFGFWACTFSSSLFSAVLLGHFFRPRRST